MFIPSLGPWLSKLHQQASISHCLQPLGNEAPWIESRKARGNIMTPECPDSCWRSSFSMIWKATCYEGVLFHLPLADSLHSQPGCPASGPRTEKSRIIRMFRFATHQHEPQANICSPLMGSHIPRVQYQYSKGAVPPILYSFRLLFCFFLKQF